MVTLQISSGVDLLGSAVLCVHVGVVCVGVHVHVYVCACVCVCVRVSVCFS